MKQLGKDYKEAFPEFISNEYSAEKCLFCHTGLQRTEASFKAFVEGLFGSESYKNITLDPHTEPDPLLTVC